MSRFIGLYLLLFVLFYCSCEKEEATLFELMQTAETNIDFQNDLPYTEAFNTYTYRNFYNGGGVALGDINNDGLVDIFFSGNIVDNKLYLNKGNWEFEDITEKAGVACPNVWSTGVSFVDINGDDLLDIYVCKAGKPGGTNRHNELFINQGDLTFKEESKTYGLDILGLSIHSAFFDYDKDGDLDCYLLNNSIRSVGGFDLQEGLRNIPDPEGNKLLKNEDGKFVEVTQAAGLYSSNIGYGLGITLSDFNQDNWTDIFISNDFFERDYLYINNQDGTFHEDVEGCFSSLSMGSMGADACDIDNDLKPDLFVTEMLPANLDRKKTKAQYETWDKYNATVKKGYHHQFSRNVLQRNMGNNHFLEIGRFSGVAATEWSWAALIQDFDNDGLKDIFISNGIYKDLLDKDYLNFFANDVWIKSKIDKNEDVITTLVDTMPSQPVQNYMYKNKGDFIFEQVSEQWGLGALTFSNGSAYGDLDNDGDLDLVINNANMPSFVYRNNLDTAEHRSIDFKLMGSGLNKNAIGTKVIISYNNQQALFENYTSKGFESSVDSRIHFGVGGVKKIDQVEVIWPNGNTTIKRNLITNQLYTFLESESKAADIVEPKPIAFSQEPQAINHKHQEIKSNLFSRERLLIEMNGFAGPAIAVKDVNADGQEDVFIGGGKKQSSVLFLSTKDNKYSPLSAAFEADQNTEAVAAAFFDVDGDGDQDLYVGNGGKTFSKYSQELNDLLYLNDGKGNFEKAKDFLNFPNPIHTGNIAIGDINKDGKPEIIVAEKMKNDVFGKPGNIYLLELDENGIFNASLPAPLKDIGMISDLVLNDVNDDGWPDLVLAGKWMPIKIVYSDQGEFNENSKVTEIPNSTGLWNTIHALDIDQDGDEDLICGNEGLNNFYKPGMRFFLNDFDDNGASEQIICEKIGDQYYPIHDVDELFSQLSFLKKKFNRYNDFVKLSMSDLFHKNLLQNSTIFDLEELKSMIYLNENGNFIPLPLPNEVQYSSVYAIATLGNKQKNKSIYLGGNNYKVKPQFGRADASLGWRINTKINQDTLAFQKPIPLYIGGQIRAIEIFGDQLIFGINNDSIKIISSDYE